MFYWMEAGAPDHNAIKMLPLIDQGKASGDLIDLSYMGPVEDKGRMKPRFFQLDCQKINPLTPEHLLGGCCDEQCYRCRYSHFM